LTDPFTGELGNRLAPDIEKREDREKREIRETAFTDG
jgi:hypothetical protein